MRLALLAGEADATESRAVELAKLAASKASADPEILTGAYILAVQLGQEQRLRRSGSHGHRNYPLRRNPFGESARGQ